MPRKQICPFRFKYKPESQGEKLRNACRSARSRIKHYTLDRSVALAKLEQLKNTVSLDLVAINHIEQYRLSSYTVFKRNLLDPLSCVLITLIYTASYLLTLESSLLSFVILFVCIYYPINYHLESYKSFTSISSNLELFRKDAEARNIFLSSLAYPRSSQHCDGPIKRYESVSIATGGNRKDTFRWANELIRFFWPYLSHIIHYELDEFFHRQIESGKLANSELGAKKFCGALIQQLKSNILEIKKCQFGSQCPEIKDFAVSKSYNPVDAKVCDAESRGETLTYDLDIEYNGNMIIKVIYRYFYCCSSKLGLEDMYLHFKTRFQVGPIQKQVPFAERISFTLMELPEYGYKGIALVELAELKVIRGLVNRAIKDHLLYPKQVSISFKEVMRALMAHPKRREEVPNSLRGDKDSQRLIKFLASSLLCGCMCLNLALKPCHWSKGRCSRKG